MDELTVTEVAGMVYVPGVGKTVTVSTGKGEVEEDGAGAGDDDDGWTVTVL